MFICVAICFSPTDVASSVGEKLHVAEVTYPRYVRTLSGPSLPGYDDDTRFFDKTPCAHFYNEAFK